MENLSIYKDIKTRIIPGLQAKHQIVAMPHWSWFWLDDFMKRNSIYDHQHMYQTIGRKYKLNDDNLIDTLKNIAEIHAEFSMRQIHNLANDNGIEGPQGQHYISKILPYREKAAIKKKRKSYDNMPKLYKLFSFMPCATTSEAVFERKNHMSIYQQDWYEASTDDDQDTDTDYEI